MNVSFQLAAAMLEGGSPREFLKSLHRPEQQLHNLRFRQYPHRNDLWGRAFPRPASMPTPYDHRVMALTVQTTDAQRGSFEIGLCTMGQFGVDYPDIWLGRFPGHNLIAAVKAAIGVLENAPQTKPTYDVLDRDLRAATKHLRGDS